MPSESKIVRSDRFTLSITGFALIALIIAIGSSTQANASDDVTHAASSAAVNSTLHAYAPAFSGQRCRF